MLEPIQTAAASWGLEKLFDLIAKGLVASLGDITQYAGIERAYKLASPSDLWHRGVDQEGLRANAKVSISGALSAYVPLCPGHPLSRPGRQLDLWLERRGSTAAFTTANFIIWGDGILVPPVTKSGLAVLGLYDHYGLVGLSSIPLIVDTRQPGLQRAFTAIVESHPRGLNAQVMGRLVRLPLDLITQFSLVPADPSDASPLPNFAIEAMQIRTTSTNPVLFGMQWAAFDKKIFPIYCNISDPPVGQRAVAKMQQELSHANGVDGVFDPCAFGLTGANTPEANARIARAFEAV